jgi:threonine dehydratase
MIGLDDIRAARARISGCVRITPMLAAEQAQEPLPVVARVILKLECLQVTGSFKARGAMNRLLAGDPAERRHGLVTASGGNHGIAIARTGYAAGVPTTVFLPETAAPAKLARIRAWGAKAEVVPGSWDEANVRALKMAAETGAAYFHPFADPLVVAGQGTLGLEIVEQAPEAATILVAIGGGGLVAGLATAVKALRPDIRIVGIEPTGSPTLKASIDAGRLVRLDAVTTKVATMACRETDQRVFERVRETVDDILLVDDSDMEVASRWLWFEHAVAADLSGAASVAALRRHPSAFANPETVIAIVCGAGPEGLG